MDCADAAAHASVLEERGQSPSSARVRIWRADSHSGNSVCGDDVTLLAQADWNGSFALSEDGGRAAFNEIHYYRLPWPADLLQVLENETVTMKVTLSYLPEPNLSPRAATRPESYRSYRFALQQAEWQDETQNDFRQRVNRLEREAGASFGADSHTNRWLVGQRAISAACCIAVWRGPAAGTCEHRHDRRSSGRGVVEVAFGPTEGEFDGAIRASDLDRRQRSGGRPVHCDFDLVGNARCPSDGTRR